MGHVGREGLGSLEVPFEAEGELGRVRWAVTAEDGDRLGHLVGIPNLSPEWLVHIGEEADNRSVV